MSGHEAPRRLSFTNVCGIEYVNSTEFDENAADLVIRLLDEQRDVTDEAATMRLWNLADENLQRHARRKTLRQSRGPGTAPASL